MNMIADSLWHMVQDTCAQGKLFFHEDAGKPHAPHANDDAPGKRYLQMMQMSAEYEAEEENNHAAALDDIIADLIANRP